MNDSGRTPIDSSAALEAAIERVRRAEAQFARRFRDIGRQDAGGLSGLRAGNAQNGNGAADSACRRVNGILSHAALSERS